MKHFLTGLLFAIATSPITAFAQEYTVASQEKTMPGGTLAMASYVALWFLLLGYFVIMTLRLTRISSDINTLEKRIDTMFNDDQ